MGEQATPGTAVADSEPLRDARSDAVVAAVVTAVILGIGYCVVTSDENLGPLLAPYRLQTLVGIAALTLVAGALGKILSLPAWLRQATGQRRAAVLTFAVLPGIVLLVVAIVFLPDARAQILVLRSAFLLVVCLLPGILFFLFIAKCKASLFKEFLANMDRLGFVAPRLRPPDYRGGAPRLESEPDRRRRIEAYLEKFEALYGPLRKERREEALQLPEQRTSVEAKPTSEGVVNVLTSETAIPVLLATVLIALVWLIVLPPWEKVSARPVGPTARRNTVQETTAPEGAIPADVNAAPAATVPPVLWFDALYPRLSPISAAFLGAYFFCLQSLFRRYVRRDLGPSAYVGVALRIILAIVGIWIIEEVWTLVPWVGSAATAGGANDGLIAAGFVIGVFPRVAWQLIAGSLKQKIPPEWLPSLQTRLPISDLDGLTVWHEARLEEEDIENVPNMATADLLELMLNTRFAPDRLVDWMDQAILYVHLGLEDDPSPRRRLLSDYGIRTATDLTMAYEEACASGNVAEFEKILPGDGYPPVRSLIAVIETSPNLSLIRMWRGLDRPPESSIAATRWTVVETTFADKKQSLPGEVAWMLRCILAEGERRLRQLRLPQPQNQTFEKNLKRFVEAAIEEAVKSNPPAWGDGTLLAAKRKLTPLWPFYS